MKQHGFTLVEMLVSMAILLLLISLGLVSYISFNDRQKLTQAQELVREAVAEVQNSARSGKMRGCSALDSYELSLAGNEIITTPVCINEADDAESQTFQLPEGLVFEGATTLNIAPVSGLITDGTANQEFDVYIFFFSNEDMRAGVRIDRSGAVKQIE